MEEDIKTLKDFYNDGSLKAKINQLLWQRLHPKTTIEEGEKLAVEIHELIENLFTKVERRKRKKVPLNRDPDCVIMPYDIKPGCRCLSCKFWVHSKKDETIGTCRCKNHPKECVDYLRGQMDSCRDWEGS